MCSTHYELYKNAGFFFFSLTEEFLMRFVHIVGHRSISLCTSLLFCMLPLPFFTSLYTKSWVSFSLTLFSTSIKQSWYQSSVLFFTSKMKYWKHFKWKCSCTPWFFEWKLAVSQGKLYGLLLGQPQVVWGVDIQTGRSAHFYPGNPVFKRNSCLTLCKTYV